jgi:TPR repeat protein
MYYSGIGVHADPWKALQLFAAAAAAREPNAMVWLSQLKWGPASTEARALLNSAAFDVRDPQAVSFWARRYVIGDVTDTTTNVLKALRGAASTGDPSAQFWYAHFLECQWQQTGSQQTYSAFKQTLIRSAEGGYDAAAADDKNYNAVTELSRVASFERKGWKLSVVGCPASAAY